MNEMNITSAQYITDEISGNISCIKCVVGEQVLIVPNNAMGNRHYDEIMRQVESGELTIEDAE